MHCCVNKGHRRTISRWVETEAEETETLPTVTPSSRSSSRSFTALKIAHSAQGGGPALNRASVVCLRCFDVDTHKNIKNPILKKVLHSKCLG